MRSRAYVFAGLSIDLAAAGRAFPGVVLGPAGPGDLDALLADRRPPAFIGIVDARFPLAVTPREIVHALEAGVKVYGAAGVGALRAVECGPLGMVGVGRVHEMYETGVVVADDEVLTGFEPETLVRTSHALVDLRVAMALAARTGEVDPTTAAAAVSVAAGLHYTERTCTRVGELLHGRVPADQVERYRAFVAGPARLGQQQADALELLATIVRDERDQGPTST